MRKISIPLHTPVLLYKSGILVGIHFMDTFSRCDDYLRLLLTANKSNFIGGIHADCLLSRDNCFAFLFSRVTVKSKSLGTTVNQAISGVCI